MLAEALITLFFTWRKSLIIILSFEAVYALLIKRQTNNYKEKLVTLQPIGIIVIKCKGTRVITYTPADILV